MTEASENIVDQEQARLDHEEGVLLMKFTILNIPVTYSHVCQCIPNK